MHTATDHFYSDLPIHRIPLGDLLIRAELFHKVPDNWHVIITDIKNSTAAVTNGRHEQVNLIATGSIVSVLNIAFGLNVTIPFFFGGDGATFLVPPGIIDRVMQALALYRTNTKNNFNLKLRTGTIPVKMIYAHGHDLRITRFCSSGSFSIPIVLGNGLNYAEQLIKGPDALLAEHPAQEEELDLSGMQCRWDRIAPPEDKEEVVTLLIVARNVEHQAILFGKIMNKMDKIYGSPNKRQPISVAKLMFKTSFDRLSLEMKARIGKIKWLEYIQTWLTNLYGFIYFRTEHGKTYLKRLVEMSDTLVIDGKINTVISGTLQQRLNLQKALDELEAGEEIFYGLHISNASIMSCYVRDMEDGHVHFVDGSEGGYTKAAQMLKGKLQL